MDKILVDADVLVALAKEDDDNHSKAIKTASRLKKATLYVTPFTIPEAATVLSYHVSQKAASFFLKEVRQKNLIELTLSSHAIQLADQIFLNQTKKRTSWIDCLNVAMVKIHHFKGIFSFDKFYQKFGINCCVK